MTIVLLLSALLGGLSPAGAAIEPTPAGQPAFVSGRFVVTDPGSTAGLDLLDSEDVLGHLVIDVEPVGDPRLQAETLSRVLGATVEPMVMYELFEVPQQEPLFGEQWALHNEGQTGGVAGADIEAVRAWQWSLGRSTVIAIVDSGADLDHPDLADRVWRNADEIAGNGLDDDANGYVDDREGWDFVSMDATPDDEVGHGTSVTSVAVAAANDAGMAGVAPLSRAMIVKACGRVGCQAGDVAEAIVYAVDNGADVVNLSLGAPGEEPLVTAAVEYAASKEVLVVAAAGNNGVEITELSPWTPVSVDSPVVVGVASTTSSDALAGSSNFGVDVIDVAAPGDQIVSAIVGGGYEVRSGTSFAAPHVAGVAALMKALDREVAATELAVLLSATVEAVPAMTDMVTSGGRLDAATAAQAARFRDIPGTLFADDIMWAAVEGVTKGCTSSLYCPDDFVSRGQMAAFLARALALPASSVDRFDDDEDSVFEADIDAIAAAGITTGCSPTDFCPEDPITRGQMAAFLRRSDNSRF